MTPFQTVFLFCRVVGTYFLWFTPIWLVSGFRSYFSSGWEYFFYPLLSLTPLVLGLILRASASPIAAFVSGQSLFEGEARSLDWALTPRFRALTRLLVGALILVFGVQSTTSSVGSFVRFYVLGSSISQQNQNWWTLISFVLPGILQILLGLVLFISGLAAFRRATAVSPNGKAG